MNLPLPLPGSFRARRFPDDFAHRSPPPVQSPTGGRPKVVLFVRAFDLSEELQLPYLRPGNAQIPGERLLRNPGVRRIEVRSSSTNSKSTDPSPLPSLIERLAACTAALRPAAGPGSNQVFLEALTVSSDRGQARRSNQSTPFWPPTRICP